MLNLGLGLFSSKNGGDEGGSGYTATGVTFNNGEGILAEDSVVASNSGEDGSLCFWLYVDTEPSGDVTLIDIRDQDNNITFTVDYSPGDGILFFKINVGGDINSWQTVEDPYLHTETIYHIMFSVLGGTGYIVVNGVDRTDTFNTVITTDSFLPKELDYYRIWAGDIGGQFDMAEIYYSAATLTLYSPSNIETALSAFAPENRPVEGGEDGHLPYEVLGIAPDNPILYFPFIDESLNNLGTGLGNVNEIGVIDASVQDWVFV